jgi:hypothetical protein
LWGGAGPVRPIASRTPGLIWVRDRGVGDVMMDGSIRRERLRPLGLLWAAASGRVREPAGRVRTIGEWMGLARAIGSVCIAQSVTGASAAGPRARAGYGSSGERACGRW